MSEQIDWLQVGARLKAQRESSNLAVADIAHRLCLTVKQVKAMESGNNLPFPGSTAHLWCIKRYAAVVGLDWPRLLVIPAKKETINTPPNILSSGASEAHGVETSTPIHATPKKQFAEQTELQRLAGIGQNIKQRPMLYIFGFMACFVLLAMMFIVLRAPLLPKNPEHIVQKIDLVNSPLPNQREVSITSVAQPTPTSEISTVATVEANTDPNKTVGLTRAEKANTETFFAAPPNSAANSPMEPRVNETTKDIIVFYGGDPKKRADSFYINARQAVTLMKKNFYQNDEGVETKLGQGTEHRIFITENEVIRIAQGDSFAIYYQGQLVPPSTLRSGKWVRLIPKLQEQ